MIVKNESANMPLNLKSVKDLIDAVCILDTGSSDNTIEVIQTWCTENSKSCKVHEEDFLDFGRSRTRAYELAQEFAKDKYDNELA